MKVSIVTVCKNVEASIELTLLSVLKQDYSNIEFIIIDGKSSDGTNQILKKYQNHFAFYISEPDHSLYEALNKGIRASTGEIIGFLHAGDVFYNHEVISKIVSVFSKENNTEAVYTDVCFVNNYNKIVRYIRPQYFALNDFRKGLMPPHPGFFCKKSCYNQQGLFNEAFEIASDFDMLLRLLYLKKISAKYLPILSVNMRTGGKSNNGLKSYFIKTKEIIGSLKSHQIKSSFTLILFRFIFKLKQFKSINN